MSTERLSYDIIIIGGGPAGLASAIHCKQRLPDKTVCLIEKGAEIGSHILSGAVLEPHSLNALLPDWQQRNAPITTTVTAEQFCFLSEKKSYTVPQWILPKELTNQGNYLISLSVVCRWLAEQAQTLGVELFTSTAATELLYEDNTVVGIKTGTMGLDQQRQEKSNFVEGFAIYCQYLVIAEGARGYLAEKIMQRYQLRQPRVQTYGLGIKELWQVDHNHYQPGLVQHTAGWPLDAHTYGGSFTYHLDQQKVAVGFVVALDYQDPTFNPFETMQRFKTHPSIKPLFQNGKRIGYGARVLNEGGYASLPTCHFPGGLLIGCAAGLLNVAKIKGIHNAIESGMLAAKAIEQAHQPHDLSHYDSLLQTSSAHSELKRSRNFRGYFRYGLLAGTVLAGLDLKLCRGKLPWTLQNKIRDRDRFHATADHDNMPPFQPDQKITFNRSDSLYFSNIQSEENQPNHLVIADASRFHAVSTLQFQQSETRYCPAQVYEYQEREGKLTLIINASNCLHCKACDIKDPSGTLQWHCPEGGSGPNYAEM